MKSESRKNNELLSDINIIPFVDIILVVLIIFLLVAPMIINPKINIQLPKAETADSKENIAALLSIDVDGIVYFNNQSMSELEINQELKKALEKNKNLKAVIAADKNVAHGNVIALIDLLRKAGVKNFAVSVQNE